MNYRFDQDNFHPEPPGKALREAARDPAESMHLVFQLLLAVVAFLSLVDVLELLLLRQWFNAGMNAVMVGALLWLGQL